MKIYLGSDHAGFAIKEFVKQLLENRKIEVIDKGAFSYESVDYPDFAHKVAKHVANDEGLGILICGSGNGICMTANKHKNIRAALCWNAEMASLAKAHNNANILCMPGRYVTTLMAEEIVDAFLNTIFEGGRHQNRINKIDNE